MSNVMSDGDNRCHRHPDNPTLYEAFYQNAATEALNGSHDPNENSKPHLSMEQLDPLHVLPPELALQCLRELLPSDSYLYSSAVLELVSVSLRWRDFALSVPTFWQEIHLMPELHDLLAVVSTFLHFSSTVSLDIIVWGDMRPELPEIYPMLLPYKNRIHRLMLRQFIQTGKLIETNSWYVPTASEIIGSLQPLSNLREVEFGQDLLSNPSQIKSLSLPPTTYITSPVDPLSSMEDMEQIEFRRITKIVTSTHFDNIVPSLESFENLTELYLTFTSGVPPPKTPILKTVPLHLKYISYHQDYCANLGRLLRVVSSQLAHLDLQVPLSKLDELVENLKSLGCLNVLVLTFANWHETVPLISNVYNITVASLHTMEISGRNDSGLAGGNSARSIIGLFEAFKNLYPMVKRIKLYGLNNILYVADQYLESLRSLEWIDVFWTAECRRIVMPSLQSICCNPGALAYFDAPNLLHLYAYGVTQTSKLDDL